MRGGAKIKVHQTDLKEVMELLSTLRSLDLFFSFQNHQKCNLQRNQLCQLCLVRLLILKSKSEKGHTKIEPIEFMAAFNHEIYSGSLSKNFNGIIEELSEIVPQSCVIPASSVTEVWFLN